MNSVVVVGAGPVGMRCAQEIIKKHPEQYVKIFGDESVQPYNRVKLSGFLNRDYGLDGIELSETVSNSNRLKLHCSSRIVSIDRDAKMVLTSGGSYHRL